MCCSYWGPCLVPESTSGSSQLPLAPTGVCTNTHTHVKLFQQQWLDGSLYGLKVCVWWEAPAPLGTCRAIPTTGVLIPRTYGEGREPTLKSWPLTLHTNRALKPCEGEPDPQQWFQHSGCMRRKTKSLKLGYIMKSQSQKKREGGWQHKNKPKPFTVMTI